MKITLLFTITFMLFILFLIPIMCPFGVGTRMSIDIIGFAYAFWYMMCFTLSLVWGHVVVKNGCWFFNK